MNNVPVNELRRLKAQLDDGNITKEEFIDARNKLLKGETPETDQIAPFSGNLDSGDNGSSTISDINEEKSTIKESDAQVTAENSTISTEEIVKEDTNNVNENSTDKEEKKKTSAGQWIKRNLISLLIIALLASSTVYLGIKNSNDVKRMQSEIDSVTKTKDELVKKNNDNQSTIRKYSNLKNNLWFYLNDVVVCVETDGNYYHRFGCPKSGTKSGQFRYNVYYPENAQSQGFRECPICFKLDYDDYIEKYLSD